MYGSRMWANLFTEQPQTLNLIGSYAGGADAMNNMRQNQIKTALSQIDLNAAPQLMQQKLDTGAADVSIKQNEAKYAPLLSQLDAQQKQIANNMSNLKFQEQPDAFKLDQQLKYANIQKLKAMVQYMPDMLGTRNLNAATNAIKAQPEGSRGSFLADNQGLYNNLVLGAMNRASQGMGVPYAPQYQSQNASGSAPVQQNAGAQQPVQSSPNLTGMPGMPPLTSVERQQYSNQMQANAKASPNMQKQLDNTVAIETFLNSPAIEMLAQSAKNYAGIRGKGKQFMDAWTGNNSANFENNLQFRNSFTSDLVNLQRRLEGLSIQPSQRAELITNIRGAFDEWSSNPDRAIDQFNRAIAQLKDIAGSTSVAGQPLYPGTKERLAGLPPPRTDHLANYIRNYSKAMGIEGTTRPGYVYVDNGTGKPGSKGWIPESQWNDPSNKKELSGYKRID
jgi:hypothetical protein